MDRVQFLVHTVGMLGIEWAIAFISVTLAVAFGYFGHFYVTFIRAESADRNAKIIRQNAERDAEVLRRESEVKARDIVLKAREDMEAEMKLKQQESQLRQERLHHREENIDRKLQVLDKKEEQLEGQHLALQSLRDDIAAREAEIGELATEQKQRLSRIAALSPQQAREQLLDELRQEIDAEAGEMVRARQSEAKAEAEREARKIITVAIQRYAADQVNQVTTTTVQLPSEDMKGRIIGKEGRNIRSLESELGVDILIDDTPQVVVVSAFDPVRREVARQTLKLLVADGRIHPAQIEAAANQARAELGQTMWKAGEDAVSTLGLRGIADEVIRTLGKLMFRTSYAQNVLEHSVEVARFMGNLAGELRLDTALARRIGLLHDIGKAIDHERDGTHAHLGAELLKRHGEDSVVVNAVEAHHGEVEQHSPYAALLCAADAIAAARPGARAETTEIYLKRLHDLEELATRKRGVATAYAIQAGRELRVIVEPKEIDEARAHQLAREISQEIEASLTYPGQVKVTVVRETRCVETAR